MTGEKIEVPVELSQYKGLKVKKGEFKVEDEEVNKTLNYLQKSRAKIIAVNNPAEMGNRVEVDFEIRQKGVKIEHGESKNHPLILGDGHFVPGFEKELIGMKANEEKNFSLQIPNDWPDKRIAGTNLDFKVKINSVQKVELSQIDDEFAKSLGNFVSLEGLKSNVRDGLMQEKEIRNKERMRIELISKVAEDSKIEVPAQIIDEELEMMINELKANITNMGLEFERYLSEIKVDIDTLKKDWRSQAGKRARIELCLKAIAKKENINVDDNETDARVNEDLKRFPDIGQAKKDIDMDRLKEYTKNVLINEKVFALLEREAEII